MSDSLFPIGALIRNTTGRFALRMRWLLGSERQELPRPDDSFELQVRVRTSDRYLRANGTFGNPGDVHTITVAPKRFAMIDPPRDLVPLPTDVSRMWQVARKPVSPVDCSTTLVERLPGGVGICHILSETQPSRIQARVERLLANRVSAAVQSVAQRSGLAAFAEPTAEPDALRELSTMIVRRGPRPLYLPRTLREQHALLVESTAARNERASAYGLFAFGEGSLAEKWRRAAVAFEVLADRSLVQALDETVTPPVQLRQQLRLRALQGGTLIDFWCSPDTASGACSDTDRGRAYPASELIGTGLTIGDFDAAEVAGWIDAMGAADTAVEIRVKHIRTVVAGPLANDDGELLDVLTEADVAFDPGVFPLLAVDVRRALDGGSSLPPAAPREASINHDFLQTNPGAENDPVQLGYVTGDSHLEIDITPGEQSTFNKTIFGFNVYGMWETASTRRFFDDPSLTPTMVDLRPFLITRKYSYERDLKGAFPTQSGVHAGMRHALDEPSWQPVLIRPTQVTNSDAGMAEETPPDVFRFTSDNPPRPRTRFNLDLRVGMDSGVEDGTRKFLLWDRDAPIKTTWTPMQSRDGAAITAPQRYRFWVTAVDAFEQESAPVEVSTHDADAGEAASTLYAPRLRGSLLPPPAGDANTQRAGRTLAFASQADGSFTVTVRWETPFLNDVGRREDAQSGPRRASKGDLVGTVKIFRRRLRRKVEEPQGFFAPLAMRSETGAFALPQWIAAVDEIDAQGWTECGSAEGIAAPTQGEVWTHAFSFGHESRGFEYLALIGMAVRSDRAAFWMPDVQRRRAFTAVKQDGKWHAVEGRIVETPRSTAVVPTEGWAGSDHVLKAGALPVPNVAPPRATVLDAVALHRASAVLPVPTVSRDAILLRLLTRDVGLDAPLDPLPWADTGIPLTLAQAATLEAALERTSAESGITDVVADPRLRAARTLLATEFTTSGRRIGYQQNMTVGFRGLALLRWRYEPFAARAGTRDEAEAEKVRVLSVRVPQDDEAAKRYATVRARGRRSGDTWTLSGVAAEHAAGLAAIEQFQQPALVRIENAGTTTWGVVSQLVTTAGTTKLKIGGTSGALPTNADLALFAAQPILDRGIDSLEDVTNDAFYLPVGGGHAEVFGYWLQSVSAQERVSGYAGTQFFFFVAPPTIEPPTPLAFRVSLPANSTADFALDPTAHRNFLPREITTLDLAQHNPRVVVTWNAFDPDEEVGIEIEREERLVDAVSQNADAFAAVLTPWMVIKAIDGLPDDALIRPDWVTVLRTTWLLGAAVDVPPEDIGELRAIHIPASIGRPLSGAAGLKMVTIPGIGTTQAAFIDYFRNAANNVAAMDGNYEYRYRISAWIDVLRGQAPQVEPERRILRGRPTSWSEWILPEPTEAAIVPDSGLVLSDHARSTPAVRLLLKSGAMALAAAEGAAQGWFYRVTVRRKLDFALRSTEQTTLEPRWREVGAPLEVLPGGTIVELQDFAVDRADVDADVAVTYQLAARQLVRTPARGERLVRTLPDAEVTITIPRPPNPEGNERVATKNIEIR